ncbi:MAG: MazG family protein [Chloroflexota bacterium]|nr:MazG family protein [Chloroflexota bacterium]
MGDAVAELARIADRLRAPDGCPWDREQTHASLRPFLLEEAYEALDALDAGDPAKLREELGDLLFQVVIHAQLAREEGEFDFGDVVRLLSEKLVRRHPHVFEGKAIEGDVLSQWEKIKRAEKPKDDRTSILDGIPAALPSLFRAERLQERIERVGLVPARVDLPIDIDDERFLGDLLFEIVATARDLGYDAETALRGANERFSARVKRVEERARESGRDLGAYEPEELSRMWEETA